MEQLLKPDTTETGELLTPDFLRKIEQLSIVARKLFSGRMRGERRSTKRGSSVEFADYRDYTLGDDFRRVDWNVYARLEKLFLKLFVEEEDLTVYVLIDGSSSMGFGEPAKFLYARRIAAALSYIALCNYDQAAVGVLTGGSAQTLSPKRGRQSAPVMLRYLSDLSPGGVTHLGDSLRDFSLRTSRPGLAVLISDCLDDSFAQGLSALASRRFEVTLLHLLDQDEVEPSIVGDLMLVDSETGEKREITVTQTLLRAYRERLKAFCDAIEQKCMRYGCGYARITNQMPFEDLILSYLRKRGMLK